MIKTNELKELAKVGTEQEGNFKLICGHNNGYKETIFPFDWVCSECGRKTKEPLKVETTKIKEFDNQEECLSSSDKRLEEHLKQEFGIFKRAFGTSINFDLETLEKIVKLMKDNNLKTIWGDVQVGDFGDNEIKYYQLVANKKTFLVYKKISTIKRD